MHLPPREEDEHASLDSNKRIQFSQINSGKAAVVELIEAASPPPRVSEALHALKERRLLIDDPPQVELPVIFAEQKISSEGEIKEGWIVPLDYLIREAAEWLRKQRSKMSEELRECVKSLRWQHAATGKHNSISMHNFHWSDDDAEWYALDFADISVSVLTPVPLFRNSSDLASGLDRFKAGCHEPLAHEILREARALLHSAPRSALIIAVASLETGIKRYLSKLLPTSEPLLNNIPSPSVEKLLRSVIPEIHLRQGKSHNYVKPNKKMRSLIEDWVAVRNRISHGVPVDFDIDALKFFIDAVSNILYFLDFLDGHDFAEKHMDVNCFEKRT